MSNSGVSIVSAQQPGLYTGSTTSVALLGGNGAGGQQMSVSSMQTNSTSIETVSMSSASSASSVGLQAVLAGMSDQQQKLVLALLAIIETLLGLGDKKRGQQSALGLTASLLQAGGGGQSSSRFSYMQTSISQASQGVTSVGDSAVQAVSFSQSTATATDGSSMPSTQLNIVA